MADDGAGGWNDNPPNDGGGEVADDGAGREVADDGAGGEVVDDSATIGLFVLGFFIYLFIFFFLWPVEEKRRIKKKF